MIVLYQIVVRMYSFKDVVKGFNRPNYIGKELHRLYNQRTARYNTEGTYIFEEDWDNLVILDALRYDYFDAHNGFDGELEWRISRGSTSREFVRGNFQGPDQFDTVYCSHNRWYEKIVEELGDDRSDVYLFEAPDVPTDKRTVGHVRDECRALSDCARKVQAEHPKKQLMVHYMVPHEPYVDEKGDILIQINRFARNGERKYPDTFADIFHRDTDREMFVSKQEIEKAYDSSVKYILSHLGTLLEDLEGRTVITADHGELLGERLWPTPFVGFGHPEGVYVDELVKVPWFIHDDGERKDIKAASEPHPSMEATREVTEEVDEQLRSMGYRV